MFPMMPLPPRYLLPVPLPTPFRPGDPRHLDPLGLHIRDTTDPHKVRDRLVDIGVLRKNGDGTYSPYLPMKADLVGGKVPASQLPEDRQGVTEVFVDGVSAVSDGTASIDLTGKVDKEQGKGLSSNDYTAGEKAKLANIEAGAQVNAIQSVKAAGTALTPDAQKAVNIPAATISARGVVKLNTSTNSTSTSEAATPSAVKAAMNNANGRASLSGDNEFSGANTFRSVPGVKTAGFTNIVFFRVAWDESLGDNVYDPVFTMGDVSMVYRSSGDLELTREFFHEFFSETCWRLLTDGEWLFAGDLSGASFYDAADGSTETFDVVRGYYDDTTGEWVEEQWKTAYIDWGGSRLDLDVSDYGEYWEANGIVVVPVLEAGTDAWIGDLNYPLQFGVGDGDNGPEGTVAIDAFCDFQFYDESGSPIDAHPADYELPGLRASTDPADPAYDPRYDDYPDEYGWRPALDTRLATMGDVPDVEAAVAAHNDDTSAHSTLFATKLGTAHNTASDAHSALFSAVDPLPSLRVNNLMDAGVLTFPMQANDGVYLCEVEPVDLVFTAGRSLLAAHQSAYTTAYINSAGTWRVRVVLDHPEHGVVVKSSYYSKNPMPVRRGIKLVDLYIPFSLSQDAASQSLRVFQFDVATDHSKPDSLNGAYVYTPKTLLSIPGYIPDTAPVVADSNLLNVMLVKLPCVITYFVARYNGDASGVCRVYNCQINVGTPVWKHVDYSFVHKNAFSSASNSFPSAVYRPEPDWTPVPGSYLGDFFTT